MNPLSWLNRRPRKDAELREELEYHLQADAEERAGSGLPDEAAKYAALRELGNTTLLYEEIRSLWSWTTVEQLGQDLRYAFRMMAAKRAFTVLAVLSALPG